MHHTKKVSLQTKLIRVFLIASAIPILFISFFSYYNISNTLKKNTEELTINNLEQTGNSLNIWLESYKDSLYQIYTDDEVVSLVDNLNAGKDISVSTNRLRRILRDILNTKKYIRSITIITSKGMRVTYDQLLTSVSNDTSWIDNFSLSEDQLFKKVSSDNLVHIFPTEFGVRFANKNYYLFHIAHRIFDYKNISKINGIVVISIDDELLSKVCLAKHKSDNKTGGFNFIVDENGRVISYKDKKKVTCKVTKALTPLKEREKAYLKFVADDMKLKKEYLSINVYHNKNLSWDIVNVNNWGAINKLSLQQEFIIFVSIISLLVAIILTVFLSRRLVSSIKKVVATMHIVSSGNLDTRVKIERVMPLEIEFIALQFNEMLGKLDGAMKKEKEAGERQLEAEIKALEAQINPHFLYNTLDTINWMAIDKEDYDISNAINSLATILRYAITNSNAMVEVRQELGWLNNYIYLQQIRLKNTFRYEVDAAPEIQDCKIHKLILQPFVENAIIHGFEGLDRELILKIKLEPQNEFVRILIKDNGKGMEQALIDEINNKVFRSIDRGSHIGMDNVLSRLQMYYGEEASVKVSSVLGEGTEVIILIPRRV